MLDLFKGIGMVLIILCHCRNCGPVFAPLNHAVDMLSSGAVLFFLLCAGFGIGKTEPRKMLKKSVREELLPYFFCGFCAALIRFPVSLVAGNSVSLSFSSSLSVILSFLFGIMNNGSTFFGLASGVGPAWFFLALFWGMQMVGLIIRTGDLRKEIAIVLLLAVTGRILYHYSIPCLGLARGMESVLPVYAGYRIRKEHYPDRFALRPSRMIAVCVLLYGVTTLPAIRNAFWIIRGGAEYLFWSCLAFLMVTLSVKLCRWNGGAVTRGFRYIGRNSFLFLIVHAVEYECVPWYWPVRVMGLNDVPELGNMLCFLLRLACCALAVRLLEKPFRHIVSGIR